MAPPGHLSSERFADRPLRGQLLLAAVLAGVGTLAFFLRVRIPHTEVFIETRCAFAFVGFALLRRWWLAGLFAATLSVPWFSEVPFHFGLLGNFAYMLPSLVVIRLVHRRLLQRLSFIGFYAAGWFVLVLLCYQAFNTPVVWAALGYLQNKPIVPMVLRGWREQPFLIESLLAGVVSASLLIVARSMDQLGRQQRRLDHLNRILLAIRNVNQLITHEKDQTRLLDEACTLLVETRGFYNAWIVLLRDGVPAAPVYHAGFEGSFDPMADCLADGTIPSCAHIALSVSGTHVTFEPSHDCLGCSLLPGHSQYAAMTVRLEHEGSVFGWLSVSVPRAYAGDPFERELFEEIAGDLAYALSSLASDADRKRIEQERAQLETQYRQAQKMEAVGQLTGGIAHDFNNLLQVINGGIDLARQELPADHPACQTLEDIAEAGLRAARLISQLLLFSRRQAMHAEPVDLNEAVADILKMLARIIGEDIRLRWHPASQVDLVQADRGMIEQALMNLCLNARDAMLDGGTLTIETHPVTLDEAFCHSFEELQPGRYIQLLVRDTGCGMDEETRQHIFEPFFTTKDVGRGTGLGLATVYGIVRQHRGAVTVDSKPGQGSAFALYWPVSSQADLGQQREQQSPPSGGNETILLVEDDKLVRNTTRRILENAGYAVETAEDGLQAVELVERAPGRFDLILLDVVMPRMGGGETYERLRAFAPDTKVLFISGYSQPSTHNRLIRQHDLPLLQKPYVAADLLRAVRDVLEDRPVA